MLAPEADLAPELTPLAVHLWKAPLDVDPDTLRWLSAPLSAAEIERAHRFAFPADRARWTAARGWLRRLLAAYVRRDPAELVLRVSAAGKPALYPDAAGLRFNLSHSAALAVFALARDREVGVDVERVDPALGPDPVPRRFLTDAERSALARLAPPARARAALRCWTGREAYLKARGTGLGTEVGLDPRTGWSEREFDVGPGYVASVVVEGGDARVPARAELVPFATPGARM